MTDTKKSLPELRQEIDQLDQQMQELLNLRASCAQQVAEVKSAEIADGEEVLFYRPEREAQVLRNVMARNKGPLPDHNVAHIFREIMSACLALEKPMQVAYLGPEGTFTQAAAIKHFGHAVMARSQASIPSVFDQVETGQCHYGVVPVENSTEGMVTHTLDNFINTQLNICGEVELPIHLHLLVQQGVKAEQVKKICAHQQALAQSRSWLEKYWPNVETEAVSSNAKAARMASEDSSIAAVAGEMAIELYSLVKLQENIQDYSNNTTRFLIIGNERVEPSGDDKTSIVVAVKNESGALFSLLEPFHRAKVMLTRIDTRPSRTETWSYVFFMEFEGHQDDEKIAAILAELELRSKMIKVLGSYPRAAI